MARRAKWEIFDILFYIKMAILLFTLNKIFFLNIELVKHINRNLLYSFQKQKFEYI